MLHVAIVHICGISYQCMWTHFLLKNPSIVCTCIVVVTSNWIWAPGVYCLLRSLGEFHLLSVCCSGHPPGVCVGHTMTWRLTALIYVGGVSVILRLHDSLVL